jgi:hypothetical protein
MVSVGSIPSRATSQYPPPSEIADVGPLALFAEAMEALNVPFAGIVVLVRSSSKSTA